MHDDSNEKRWAKLDWKALERLRARFISENPSEGRDYWESALDLDSYDLTFGERIGWKWDAVLHELKRRAWTPPVGRLVDWGCGSGVAGRRLLAEFGAPHFGELQLSDQSRLAVQYAQKRAGELCGSALKVAGVESSEALGAVGGTLLLSHVLNELRAPVLEQIVACARHFDAVIWVEAGTHEVSRELSRVRDQLLGRGEFLAVAPCTHSSTCGVLKPGLENDWCHSHSYAPSFAHQDRHWSEFSRRLGIDLRRLPLSFLVLQKKSLGARDDSDWSRCLGEARFEKGYAKILECHGQRGVGEIILQKRDGKALLKALNKGLDVPLGRFVMDGKKIRSGEFL